jgi:glutathione S-transferase
MEDCSTKWSSQILDAIFIPRRWRPRIRGIAKEGAMIKLYRFNLSGHCHRVEVFLRLLKLPYQVVEIDLTRAEQKRPGFMALNVFGQVPVIDDDGTVVPDSNAILTYLALRHAPEHWLPRDPLGAARVQRWLSAAAGPLDFGPATARVIQLFKQTRDPAAAMALAHRLFTGVERTLAEQGTAFIVAEQPTIADIALYTYTAHAPEGNVSLADYPRLRAWLARVEALPGFVPMPASAIGLCA